MSVILLSPSHPMLVAPGKPALWGTVPGNGGSGGGGSGTGGSGNGGSGGTGTGTTGPSAIAGLSGWWDAGALASMLTPAGAAVTAFGTSVGSLADKSGAGVPLTVFHAASSGTSAPVATPRLNGLLGGLGRSMPQSVRPTAAACTATRTSRSFGTGVGTCRILMTSGFP